MIKWNGTKGMPKEFLATDVEVIRDDEEGLTSLCVRWCDIGGYLCVARDPDEEGLYCEYCDQSNGFYSKTIRSKWLNDCIAFELGGIESFSATERIQQLRIRVEARREEIGQCIELLFSS